MTLIQTSRRSGSAAALSALAGILYVAAVVIALPLGVSGVMEEHWCAIPLAAANILLALAMLSSKPAGSH